MAKVFGSVQTSMTREGQQITVFHIPAFTKRLAQRRAKFNSRVKDLANPDIESIEKVGEGELPRQGVYEVTVISSR